MTRLITDGAETGGLPIYKIGGGFISYSNDYSIDTSKRTEARGSYSHQCGPNSGTSRYNTTFVLYYESERAGDTEWYVRFAMYDVNRMNVSGTTYPMIFYDSSASTIVAYVVASHHQGTRALYWGDGTYICDMYNYGEAWILWEFYIRNASGDAEIICKKNGIQICDYTTSVSRGLNDISRLRWSCNTVGWGWEYMFIDDIAVNNGDGAVDNTWIGNGTVEALRPNGNGTSSGLPLTGSDGDSTDNYLLVDDLPNDGDTTYVRSASSGYYDRYSLADLGSSLASDESIARLWAIGIVRKVGAGPLTAQFGIRSGSTDDWKTAVDPAEITTSYKAFVTDEWLVNPDDSLGWSEVDLDDLEAMIKIT